MRLAAITVAALVGFVNNWRLHYMRLLPILVLFLCRRLLVPFC
jgi:hypothetical protein